MERDLHQPAQLIDAHQHLWKPSERRYEWLDPLGLPLNADFGPEDVESEIRAAGVSGTVLVQAADSYEDTFYMLSVARSLPSVIGVVAWAPLDRTAETEAALSLYSASPSICGVRVLSHNYPDPRWLLRETVTDSIRLLPSLSLTLDVVCVSAEQLAMAAELAGRHPALTIVIDHLGNPDVANRGWEPWASLLADIAAHPNVTLKFSGLGTLSSSDWVWWDWTAYVDHAMEHFGSSRVMMGSDWPVSKLAGDFQSIWLAQRQVIARFSNDEQDDILYRTALRTYSQPQP